MNYTYLILLFFILMIISSINKYYIIFLLVILCYNQFKSSALYKSNGKYVINTINSDKNKNTLIKIKDFEKYDKYNFNLFYKALRKFYKHIDIIHFHLDKNIPEINLQVNSSLDQCIIKLKVMMNHLHNIIFSIENLPESSKLINLIHNLQGYYYEKIFDYVEIYNKLFYKNPDKKLSPINFKPSNFDIIENKTNIIEQPYNSFNSYEYF